MEDSVLWVVFGLAFLVIASDWSKLSGLLKFRYVRLIAILAIGGSAPPLLTTIGVPIWLSLIPCYLLMMVSILTFRPRSTA